MTTHKEVFRLENLSPKKTQSDRESQVRDRGGTERSVRMIVRK